MMSFINKNKQTNLVYSLFLELKIYIFCKETSHTLSISMFNNEAPLLEISHNHVLDYQLKPKEALSLYQVIQKNAKMSNSNN